MAMNDNREVTYEIVEEIGIISSHPTGWNKEINMVSWNGNSAKYDIRDWSPDHAQMGRGITLHEKEMRMILDLLRKRPRSSRISRVERDEMRVSEKDEPHIRDDDEAPFMETGEESHDYEEETAEAV